MSRQAKEFQWSDWESDIEGKAARVTASEPGGEGVSMELMGSATHLRRGYGAPSIEGKAAREAASECGQRASFNGANGISDVEHVAIWNRAGRRQRR